jgi:hypothetical protein
MIGGLLVEKGFAGSVGAYSVHPRSSVVKKAFLRALCGEMVFALWLRPKAALTTLVKYLRLSFLTLPWFG